MKKNKKLIVIIAVAITLLIVFLIFALLLKNDKNNEGVQPSPTPEVVIPDAPAENTESLLQNLEKAETASLDNDKIEFTETTKINEGDKVAVWIYSTPKFLGYFEVIIENGAKQIKGLAEALAKVEIEPGNHNIAIVTEEGNAVGYVDVYVEENKLFEDEHAAIVSKYTTEEVTETYEIKYKTETRKDANKKNGYKEVTQKGANGYGERTFKITYDENGIQISKEKISEKVITAATNEIVVVGSSDYNLNTSKINGEFVGFMCTEDQTMEYDGQKVCDDSLALSQFRGIKIDNSVSFIVEVNESGITPVKVSKTGSLYKGTYQGKIYYFESRGGSGEQIPLTPDLCNKYKLKCGSW